MEIVARNDLHLQYDSALVNNDLCLFNFRASFMENVW